MGTSNLGRSILRVGEVTSTLPEKGKVKVKFPDMDDLISHEMWVVYRKTKKDKEYFMPDIGDQVLCGFLGNGLEAGYVLGAIYSEKDKPPVECQDKTHHAFADGTWCEYDRKDHKMRVHVEGDLDIFCTGTLSIESAKTTRIAGQKADGCNWAVAVQDPDRPENAAKACGWKAPDGCGGGTCGNDKADEDACNG